jgi:hypothetical protein
VTDAGANDFAANELRGTLLWEGAPVDARNAAAPCGLHVRVGSLGAAMQTDGSYSIPFMTPGTYSPILRGRTSQALLTTASVVVGSGPVVHDIELSSGLSRVVGSISLEGTPVASPFIDIDYIKHCSVGDGSGGFSMLLPPGSYQAAVRTGAQSGALGMFAFSVGSAGETVDLGTFELQPVESQDAVVRGHVLFDGAPFEPVGDPCGLVVNVWGYEYERPINPDGSFDFSVPVRNETGHAYVGTAMQGEGAYFGEQSLPLVGGLITQRDIDITATAGVVEGTITANGEPVQAQVSIPALAMSGACFLSDTDGAFRLVLPPGTHTLNFRSIDTMIATRIVTATAGTTLPLDVNVPCPDGEPSCVTGFWIGALTDVGRCSLMLLQASGGGVSGSASCARSHGPVSGTFDSGTQRLLLTMSLYGSAPISVDAVLSSGSLSGSWSGDSAGSVDLSRTRQQAITYIGASSGGELTTSLGDILDVAPASLAGNALIEASAVTLPAAPPPGYGGLPYAYDFGPDGLSFSEPARLAMAFDAAELVAEGLDPAQAGVYLLVDGAWQPVTSSVDAATETVIASVEHFSTYALMAPQLPVATTPTAQPSATWTAQPSSTSSPAPSETATAPSPTATTSVAPTSTPSLTTATPGAHTPSPGGANDEQRRAAIGATQAPGVGPPPPSGVIPAAGAEPSSIGLPSTGAGDAPARSTRSVAMSIVITTAGLALLVLVTAFARRSVCGKTLKT